MCILTLLKECVGVDAYGRQEGRIVGGVVPERWVLHQLALMLLLLLLYYLLLV